jgi:hypothetical protein
VHQEIKIATILRGIDKRALVQELWTAHKKARKLASK